MYIHSLVTTNFVKANFRNFNGIGLPVPIQFIHEGGSQPSFCYLHFERWVDTSIPL